MLNWPHPLVTFIFKHETVFVCVGLQRTRWEGEAIGKMPEKIEPKAESLIREIAILFT